VVSVEENGKRNFSNEKYEEVKTLEKKIRQSDRCPLAHELERERAAGKTLRAENSAPELRGRKSNQKTASPAVNRANTEQMQQTGRGF
jgi:hypothetical protein